MRARIHLLIPIVFLVVACGAEHVDVGDAGSDAVASANDADSADARDSALDADALDILPEIAEPAGICRETLARGAVRDEFFPRFTNEPKRRLVFRDDFFDPQTQVNDFPRWQRVRGRINPIGAHDVDSNVRGITYATTLTYARTDPDQPLTFQRFLRTAEGFDAYIAQFSVLINGRAVDATYRTMSLDGEVIDERIARGNQQIVDRPYAAAEVTFEPSQLPANEIVDIALLSWIRPYDGAPRTLGTFTTRYTLYNGGNAWPDETVAFHCPPDKRAFETEYERRLQKEAFLLNSDFLYFPDLEPKDHLDFIEVDSDEVEIWYLARNILEGQGSSYVYHLYVNGEPQGGPIFITDPESGSREVLMRRLLEVQLDPDQEVNVVHVSAFVNPLDPIFTAQGKVFNRKHTMIGMSNILYLRNTNRSQE